MKLIRAWQLFAVLIFLFSTGCASVNLQSNKSAPPREPFDRLFVLINHGDTDKQQFSNLLADGFRTALSNAPVTLDIGIISPLELDESVHERRMNEFEPDAVLAISVTGGTVGEHGGYPTLLYDASLLGLAEETRSNRLWRAHINNSGGTAVMRKRMTQMAQKIVADLQASGFLPRSGATEK